MASCTNNYVAQITSVLGPFAIPALALFGVLSLLSCGYKIANAFLSLFVLSGTNLRKFGPKGSWALVTGASDGIGKEFSLQLASKGFNVFLVSRTESKLAELATEIEKKYDHVETKILPMDFARNDPADYARLKTLIEGLDIAVLVNNVGKSHDIPVPFLETAQKEMDDIITINVTGTLKVTQLVAPGMVSRKRGLILTMGSFGGLLPTPLLATYSGSKAFLQHWSTALGAELARDNVQVQLVVGYLITSAMSKIRKPSMTIPTPRMFVQACLGKIGVKGTAAGMEGTITPFWAHGVMHWAIQEVLGIWNGTVLRKNLGMHVAIRKRALKKREREAAAGKKERTIALPILNTLRNSINSRCAAPAGPADSAVLFEQQRRAQTRRQDLGDARSRNHSRPKHDRDPQHKSSPHITVSLRSLVEYPTVQPKQKRVSHYPYASSPTTLRSGDPAFRILQGDPSLWISSSSPTVSFSSREDYDMSIFETPPSQRQFQSTAYAATSTHAGTTSNPGYPDLPAELRTPSRTGNYSPAASAFVTPERPPQAFVAASEAIVPQQQVKQQGPTTDNLTPVARAAKTVNEYLTTEARYPQLDDIVSQGQSSDYDLPRSSAWEPFERSCIHTIPDTIFEQYNRATSHTLMGLFAELKQAWITVDNRLYLWDYTTQGSFQGYEAQPNNITAVRLLTPKAGVFVKNVNYVLVVATTVDIFLLGVEAVPNARGGRDVTLYETRMSVPTKGLGVSIIEGSKNTGRIFFGGRGDNDVYEFTYQAEEKWFYGRCGKVCHTGGGVGSFTPRLPFLSAQKDTEFIMQMVMDDTRNLLYTLSSKSAIRAFHIKGDTGLALTITHSFSHTLANIRVMIGNTPLLEPKTPIIAISPVTAQEARRTHLIAMTTSGCRLFMSAVTSEYGFGGADGAPTAMQVIHVRFPPPGSGQSSLRPTRKAKVFPPGYFFCFVDKPDSNVDELFLSAPDSGKIALLAESGTSRLQLAETGMTMNLDSRVEAVELVSAPFGASKGPNGFGNEAAVQYDLPPTEVAILTNSGIHIIKRRRLVEVFDAAIRYGSTVSPLGVEGEVRKFFETYGRGEGCASALAVACGASTETVNQMQTRITDVEVCDLARKYFIEFGGKPRTESIYDSYDSSVLPGLDNIKVSGRAEGIALYISRIVRSIWKAPMIVEGRGATGASYATNVQITKLKSIQEQLVRLSDFLQTNRSFIVGLSGAESLMGLGSRVEEVAQQAEHRMLHALVSLIASMIEGISFVLFLFDDKLDDIILSLPTNQRDEAKRMTYAGLFTSETGQALAKELVTAIVNRNIAAGMNVDTIADALRRRCGSFCSADDVVVFKAIEQVRRAKTEADPDARQRLLRESLRLFEETAGSLTMENLRDTLGEYRSLSYYPGAVQLALKVANENDRGNEALGFLADGGIASDPRAQFYQRRVDCYELIFQVLDELDAVYGTALEMQDGVPTAATRIRNETWTLAYTSTDETWHNTLYDWLFDRGHSDRLLEADSPHVLSYLKRTSVASLPHCDLLWQYHARRENFLAAAEVLHKLAQSEFELPLEKRLEFLSRARGFCNSYGPMGMRQKMNELSHTIQEELDVVVIQDDVLRRIKEDERISLEKKERLTKELDSNLISLSDLFNKYADPYGYMDICLAIFQGADYRGANEIKKCWEQLISQVHEKAVSEQQVQPFELVADTVRRLGHRFHTSEYIFPPNDLVTLLEIYAFENQRDVGPPNWVVDALCDSGILPETILRILDEMFWRDEIPFKGTSRRRLVRDAAYVVEKWLAAAMRKGEKGMRTDMVKSTLAGFLSATPDAWPEKERILALVADIEKRMG